MKITSMNKLADLLGISKTYLQDLATRTSDCYRPYTKTKKRADGTIKERCIDNPNQEIKKIQKAINKKILMPLQDEAADFMHGARRGRSIQTNAAVHVGTQAILSLDLEDCFPNISRDRVYEFFRKECGCIPLVADTLTKLTTYKKHLPQGAPTSASLCNLILQPTLQKLQIIAEKNSLNFSQFIDDLFFSGMLPEIWVIRNEVLKVLQNEGWKVNLKKNKIQFRSDCQSITSVITNQKISAGRRRIRRILREIGKINITTFKRVNCKDGKERKVYNYERTQGKIASVAVINSAQGKYLQRKFNKRMQDERHRLRLLAKTANKEVAV